MDEKLRILLSDKPEAVWPLPEWMLPAASIRELEVEPSLALIEIAGRDSIAASVIAARSGRFSAFLPTIAFTGTQFGDWEIAPGSASRLVKLVGGDVRVYPPVFLGSPAFWRELCGRSNLASQTDYGFYSPCTACHLYFHSLRIPLALSLGATTVVAGERDSHEGRVKMSQLGVSLDLYGQFLRSFGLELLMPLRRVMDNAELLDMIGTAEWEEGEKQLQCVLSGNYTGNDENATVDEAAVKRFLTEFAIPLADDWVREKPGSPAVLER